MNKLNTAVQIVYPTLFLVYNTKDAGRECQRAPASLAWSFPS